VVKITHDSQYLIGLKRAPAVVRKAIKEAKRKQRSIGKRTAVGEV